MNHMLDHRKQTLNAKLDLRKGGESFENTTDWKFIISFRSRLNEEGIPLHHAGLLSCIINVNLDGVNEDDDYVNDVALKLAEIVADHWRALDKHNFTRNESAIEMYFRGRFDYTL